MRRGASAAARRRSTGGAVTPGAFRANFTLDNGITTTSTSVAGTIPGTVVAGDVALVEIQIAGIVNAVTAAPSGWTLLSGPNSDTASQSWLYAKQLVSGDVGAAVSWSTSANGRSIGHGAVYSGVTLTGRVLAVLVQDALTTSITVPTVASVPAGSVVHVGFGRVRGTTPAEVTVPGGYTQGASERSASAFASGTALSAEAAYRVASTAGSYGGETASTDLNSRGTTYAVALPPA